MLGKLTMQRSYQTGGESTVQQSINQIDAVENQTYGWMGQELINEPSF
jgi:hypothetical protein